MLMFDQPQSLSSMAPRFGADASPILPFSDVSFGFHWGLVCSKHVFLGMSVYYRLPANDFHNVDETSSSTAHSDSWKARYPG